MTKLFAMLGIVLLVLGLVGYKLYRGLVGDPRDKGKQAEHQLAVSSKSPVTDQVLQKAPAEQPAVIVEEFRLMEDKRRFGYHGPAQLRTSHGIYIQGEMCRYGIVEAIRSPDLSVAFAVVRCKSGDRETYVVAQPDVDTVQAQPEKMESPTVR